MAASARGLEGVVVTATRLSRVDGDAGRLLIGGFAVEELAPRARYEEVLFLLLHDRLPRAAELAALEAELAARRALAMSALPLLREAARRQLEPMDALRLGVSALALADPGLARGELNGESEAANRARAVAIVAALPVLLAAYARLARGAEPVAPDLALGHAANLLWMLGGETPRAPRVRALETYLNTTIDHGLNASTFTARVIVSTRSDLLSAVEGALGALKGPLHGGAPGPALRMLREVCARAAASGRPLDVEADAWIARTLDAGGRLMGFGHRVYRVRDPRADVLGAALERLLAEEPDAHPLLDEARVVEAAALRALAARKPERRLETNVEFYTALLLDALGLREDAFTPVFAAARVGGWTAHALEQIAEDRLIRPRADYCGALGRRWTPLEGRSEGPGLAAATDAAA